MIELSLFWICDWIEFVSVNCVVSVFGLLLICTVWFCVFGSVYTGRTTSEPVGWDFRAGAHPRTSRLLEELPASQWAEISGQDPIPALLFFWRNYQRASGLRFQGRSPSPHFSFTGGTTSEPVGWDFRAGAHLRTSLLLEELPASQWAEISGQEPIPALLFSAMLLFYICWSHLLVSSVGLICWSHLLVSSVGLICWSHLLVSSVGLVCWSHLLVSTVGLICWSHCVCLAAFIACDRHDTLTFPLALASLLLPFAFPSTLAAFMVDVISLGSFGGRVWRHISLGVYLHCTSAIGCLLALLQLCAKSTLIQWWQLQQTFYAAIAMFYGRTSGG